MMSGITPHRNLLMTMSLSDPCIISTVEEHGYNTGDFVRITDIGECTEVNFGGDQINNKRYKIVVISVTEFILHDPITDEEINSTSFSPYTTHGRVNLIRHDFVYEP